MPVFFCLFTCWFSPFSEHTLYTNWFSINPSLLEDTLHDRDFWCADIHNTLSVCVCVCCGDPASPGLYAHTKSWHFVTQELPLHLFSPPCWAMPDFGFIPKIAHSWTLSPKRGTVCSACAGQTVQSVFVCLCVCVCVYVWQRNQL